jgi:hypothetical protein
MKPLAKPCNAAASALRTATLAGEDLWRAVGGLRSATVSEVGVPISAYESDPPPPWSGPQAEGRLVCCQDAVAEVNVTASLPIRSVRLVVPL